jgi:hypothetical protein
MIKWYTSVNAVGTLRFVKQIFKTQKQKKKHVIRRRLVFVRKVSQ